MLRAIREIQPRWVVGENVLGLVNWSDGLVFHEVQADLEAEGYEVQPFVLPAVSVNAPHRRDRVWFVAHARDNGDTRDTAKVPAEAAQKNGGGTQSGTASGEQIQLSDKSSALLGDVAYSNCGRMQESILQHTDISSRPIGYNEKIAENAISDGLLCGESQQEGAEVREQRDISAGNTEWVCGEEMAGVTADTISNGRQKHSGSMECESRTEKAAGHKFTIGSNDNGTDGDAADTYGIRLEHGKEQGEVGDRSAEIRGTRSEPANAIETNGEVRHAADTNGIGLRRESDGVGNAGFFSQNDKASYWQTFPTVSPICDGDDGISNRLDGITFSKWRQESIKAGGNAVVPHVVLQIFRTIEEYEKMNTP